MPLGLFQVSPVQGQAPPKSLILGPLLLEEIAAQAMQGLDGGHTVRKEAPWSHRHGPEFASPLLTWTSDAWPLLHRC